MKMKEYQPMSFRFEPEMQAYITAKAKEEGRSRNKQVEMWLKKIKADDEAAQLSQEEQ